MSILGFKQAHKSQRDIELLLRLLGLFETWGTYERPMISFLNKTMNENKGFDNDKTNLFKSRFAYVSKVINENIEKPFRPKGVINTAMLDAVFVALLEQDNIDISQLNSKYQELIQDQDFISNTFGPTADSIVLKRRIEVAKQYLN